MRPRYCVGWTRSASPGDARPFGRRARDLSTSIPGISISFENEPEAMAFGPDWSPNHGTTSITTLMWWKRAGAMPITALCDPAKQRPKITH